MKSFLTVAVVSSASLLLILSAVAKEEKQGGSQEFTLPRPGPEHEFLKKGVGIWDATVEEASMPGAPPRISKGVETSTMLGGDLWLVTEYKGEMMGQPFHGHGITGYDRAKKKYTGIWVDGMTTALGIVEGTYDKASKTMHFDYEGHDEAGNPVKMKTVTVWKGEDHRVWTASMVGGDGKEIPMLTIDYKRRK